MRLNLKKGIVIIVVYLVIITLVVWGLVLLSRSVSEKNIAEVEKDSLKALYIAEAGIEKAIWELRYGGGNWIGWTDSGANKIIPLTIFQAGDTRGDYTVNVTNPDGDNPSVLSTAYVPDQALANASRTIKAELELVTESIFQYAVFGGNSVRFTGGSSTDSYNSSQGPYDPNTAGSNGDVGSNGDITLSGQSTYIDGDAAPGPGDSVSDPNKVSGSTDPASSDVELPSIDLADYSTNNSNGSIGLTDDGDDPFNPPGSQDLNIGSNDNITLGSGTYYFTSVDVGSQSSITAAEGAEVTIYCTGDIDLSGGGIVNASQDPASLIIYSTGSLVDLSGQSDFYGAVYAPNATIDISGGADFYGSLIGGLVVDITGGSKIHYDEALLESSTIGNSTYQIKSWQEM